LAVLVELSRFGDFSFPAFPEEPGLFESAEDCRRDTLLVRAGLFIATLIGDDGSAHFGGEQIVGRTWPRDTWNIESMPGFSVLTSWRRTPIEMGTRRPGDSSTTAVFLRRSDPRFPEPNCFVDLLLRRTEVRRELLPVGAMSSK